MSTLRFLTAAWFGSGLATVFVPLIMFWIARASNSYNNNNYNYNGGYNNNYQYGNYNNNQNNNGGTPWWYWGANGEQARRDEGTPAVLVAAYLWSLLVFMGILLYGHLTLRHGADTHGVVVALALFANFSLLGLFLFGGVEGAIETEGPAVEEHGFVGQFGVMMYLTSLFWIIFSIAFAIVFHRAGSKSPKVSNIDVAENYRIHDSGEGI